MSYDLYFWRYESEANHPPGKRDEFVEHMNALIDDHPPDDIMALPTDEIVRRVEEVLTADGWTRDQQFWDKDGATIEFYPANRKVSFSLRHKWTGDHANRLIEAMRGFGCPLFDPQTGERFVP